MRYGLWIILAVLLSPAASLAQSKWGGDAPAAIPAPSVPSKPAPATGNRPPPPPPATSSSPSSSGGTPPPRPPGMGLQAIDPLVTGYSFRGIDMTHEMRNVSLYVGEDTIIWMHQDVGLVSIRIKSKPYTGALPKGAYTVGVEVKTAPCNADAKEVIQISFIAPGGDSVVQSCPVTGALQRCIGFSTGVTGTETRLFEIKIKPGSRQCPAPELKKILMDVPV